MRMWDEFRRRTCPVALLVTAGLFFAVGEATAITWDGGGGDNNWSTELNWDSDSVPGSEDDVVFKETSTKNCTVDIGVNVKGIEILELYTGTITQAAGQTMTFGASGFKQSGGTFLGGNSTIDLNSTFELTDGTFTSTSGTLSADGDFKVLGGTFNHNSGTLLLDASSGRTVDIGSTALHHLTLQLGSNDLTFVGTTLDVNGDFTITSVGQIAGGGAGGTITVAGDVVSTDTSLSSTSTIKLDGSGNQTLGASGGSGEVPKVTIDKSGGTLTIQDTIEVTGDWTYTAGTVDAGTSTVKFQTNALTVNSGSMAFNDVELDMGSNNLSVTGTMDVNGDLTISNVRRINTGTIAVAGNVTTTDTTVTGSGTIKLDGGGNQTLGASGSSGEVPKVTIDKSGGTLTIQDTIEVTGDWTYTAGTVDAGTSTVKFQTSALTVDSGSMSFNNVTLDMGTSTLTVTGTMDVNGDLTITAVGSINTGTIAVASDVTSTDAAVGGTGTIELDGTGAQTITASGGDFPAFTVNKSSGTATLGSDVTWDALLTVTSGTLDHGATFNLTAEQGITIGASGTYSNTGTGDLTLGGNLANSGTVSFDAGGSGSETNDILIRSSAAVQRTWSGSGTFSMTDVDVSYMLAGSPPGSITANSSTDSGNNTNWVFKSIPAGSRLVITTAGGVTSAVAGSTFTLTITARDPGNNVVSDYTGPYSLTWTPTGGSAVTLVSSSSSGWANGVVTASVSVGGSNAGPGSFSAIDSSLDSLTAGSLAFTWYPASFEVKAESTTLTAGKSFDLKVTAKDQNALTVTRYSGAVNLKLIYSDPTTGTETLSKSSISAAEFTSGAASVSIKYLDAGTIQVKAEDTTYISGITISGTSKKITFSPDSFELTLSTLPLRLTKFYINQPFEVTVQALAADGTTVTPNFNQAVTLSMDGVTMDAQTHTFSPSADQGKHLFEELKATTSGEGTLKAKAGSVEGTLQSVGFRSAQLVINPTSGAPGKLTTSAFIQDIDTEEVVSKDDSTAFTLILESPSQGSVATAKTLQNKMSSGTTTLEVTKPNAGNVVVSATVDGFSMPVVSATLKWITGATRSGTGLNILQFEQKELPMRMRRLDPTLGEPGSGLGQLPTDFEQMKDSFTEGGTRYDAGVAMGYMLVAPPEWVGQRPDINGQKLPFDFETLPPGEEFMREVFQQEGFQEWERGRRHQPPWLLGPDDEELLEEEEEGE